MEFFAKAGVSGGEPTPVGWKLLGVGAELAGCSDIEKRLRRGMGKLWRGPRKAAKDSEESLGVVLRRCVEAGLEVQQAGRVVGEEKAEELTKLTKDRRLGLKYGRRWRGAVVTGGVARVARLADWVRSVDATWLALSEVAGAGWVGHRNGSAGRLVEKLGMIIAIRSEAVRRWAPRSGAEDACWLILRARVKGWRFRAARNQRGAGRVSIAGRQRDSEAELLLQEAGQEWAEELDLGGAGESEEWREEPWREWPERVQCGERGMVWLEVKAAGFGAKGKGRLRVEWEAAWRDACAARLREGSTHPRGSKGRAKEAAEAKHRRGWIRRGKKRGEF